MLHLPRPNAGQTAAGAALAASGPNIDAASVPALSPGQGAAGRSQSAVEPTAAPEQCEPLRPSPAQSQFTYAYQKAPAEKPAAAAQEAAPKTPANGLSEKSLPQIAPEPAPAGAATCPADEAALPPREFSGIPKSRRTWPAVVLSLLAGLLAGLALWWLLPPLINNEPIPEPDSFIDSKLAVMASVFTAPAEADPLADLAVGDSVAYGSYGDEALKWRVLAVEEGKALLITASIIDVWAYNESGAVATWEDSSIRQWLNDDFLYNAFSSSERNRIVVSKNINGDNPIFSTPGGANTSDRVFLLSLDQAVEYFADDADRVAVTGFSSTVMDRTAKAIAESERAKNRYTRAEAHTWLSDHNGSALLWWLRSPGKEPGFAASVDAEGKVSRAGSEVFDLGVGLRPAIWVTVQ